MPSVGILIVLVIAGMWMCIKGRAAGPAAAFAALTVLFVVSTPVGSGLPNVVGTVFSAIDSAATPALTGQSVATAGVRR
jgi:hypothetical protein